MIIQNPYSSTDSCPICQLTVEGPIISSKILKCDICSECDYLIGLGFSNYDEQPEVAMYPSTWVYDRIETLTGLGYLRSKRIWLDEVVGFLKGLQASGEKEVELYIKNRGKTPEQALEEAFSDIDRIEELLRETHTQERK